MKQTVCPVPQNLLEATLQILVQLPYGQVEGVVQALRECHAQAQEVEVDLEPDPGAEAPALSRV